MPLHFIDHLSGNGTIRLDNVTYTDEGTQGKRFVFSDGDQNNVIVKYIPPYFSEWNPNKFSVFLFENVYLDAENDIYPVIETSTNSRWGYIFPVAALDSNEHSYVEDNIFRNYRTVAYHLLLNRKIEISFSSMTYEYSLSELFPNKIICILANSDLEKVPNFRIDKFALSFLKYDYLIFDSEPKAKKAYIKTTDLALIRTGKKIKITISKFDITQDKYMSGLFLKHQLQSDVPIVRFIFLYQIIEHLIAQLGDHGVNGIVAEYTAGRISKHTLREQLGALKTDRSLVVSVLTAAKLNSVSSTSFLQSYWVFCDTIMEQKALDLPNAIYNLRNTLTHNFRVTTDHSKIVTEVLWEFERVILDFLITYEAPMLIDSNPLNTDKDSKSIVFPQITTTDIIAKLLGRNLNLFQKILLLTKVHYLYKRK